MNSKFSSLVVVSATCMCLCSSVRADSDMGTVLPYTSGTRITANSLVGPGTRYGRVIRLQHSGTANGTLIATFESWPHDFRFYKSTDDGFSWEQISAPVLSSTAGWVMKVEPDLFELPSPMGGLPAGTLLLAGNSSTIGGGNNHRMEVWFSLNRGLTWHFRGVADQSTDLGMWEPRLDTTSDGNLVCYYSDERYASSGYNQRLAGRVSSNGGVTWGDEFLVCAIPDGVKRPGMAITTRLPNGQHVLCYEGVAFGAWSQVYIKFSDDGVHWGSGPSDLGTPVQTTTGAYIGACPYITWIPAGGPNGTLIISGQFLRNTANTDRQFFINTNLGQGPWTMVPSAVQWQGGGNNLTGWSQGMIPTADGNGILQLASSQITVNGDTNHNEMLVARVQLIAPGQTYTLWNEKSGLAVTVPGNSPVHGLALQQDNITGDPSQAWRFNDLGNNIWTIVNPGNGLAWDDSGWGTTPGTKLEQWDYNGLPVQQFRLRPVGNGAWEFINVHSALTASVTNASTSPGAPLYLWTDTPTTEQNWFPSQPNAPQQAHYRLDGNVLDNSGHGNDGAPGSTTTNYVRGRFGALALQFNGINDYVRIPRCVGGGAHLTVAFWMKTASTGGAGSHWYHGAGLVDGEVAGTANDFGVSLLNGKVAFGVGNPDTTLSSTASVNDNEWHHIIVTRNALDGRMAIYVDGTLDASLAGPAGGRVAPPYLRLGSLQTGLSGYYFSGTLDDVRLYNGWMDSTTLSQLASPPTPQAHLKFDESSGTYAADSTGHGWTGTLMNGPTWITGNEGNAISLNSAANQHISLPNGVVNDLTRCSITAWVHLGANGNWARLFDFGTGTSNYMFLSPVGANDRVRFAITTSGGAGEQIIDHDTPLPGGAWHHLAVTLGAGTGILYVDGTPVGTNNAMTLSPANLGEPPQNWIGRSQYAVDAHLNGVVDDFRIYSGVLTPEEVASLVTPLDAPTGLAATRGDNQVTLDWDIHPEANRYTLKRSTTNGGPYTVLQTNLTELSFIDAEVTNGLLYHYVVTALNTVTESTHSAQASARPASAIPCPIAFSMTTSQLHLNWPQEHIGWSLQAQTNPLSTGLTANWFPVPNSDGTNQFSTQLELPSGSIFFRLLSPY